MSGVAGRKDGSWGRVAEEGGELLVSSFQWKGPIGCVIAFNIMHPPKPFALFAR